MRSALLSTWVMAASPVGTLVLQTGSETYLGGTVAGVTSPESRSQGESAVGRVAVRHSPWTSWRWITSV